MKKIAKVFHNYGYHLFPSLPCPRELSGFIAFSSFFTYSRLGTATFCLFLKIAKHLSLSGGLPGHRMLFQKLAQS